MHVMYVRRHDTLMWTNYIQPMPRERVLQHMGDASAPRALLRTERSYWGQVL